MCIRDRYLRALKKYAALTNSPLKLAVYWSRWNKWTLVDVDYLDCSKEVISFGLPEAYGQNEMHLLGDCWLGSIPPLSMRFYADESKPREIGENGIAGFTIKKLCLCANGVDIDDPIERAIAWFLLLNGNWSDVEKPVEATGNLVDFVETQFFPSNREEREEDDFPCDIIGTLSEMITSQYQRATTDEGEVSNLIPKSSLDKFGVLIPDDYKGEALKLWRFYLHPNRDLLGGGKGSKSHFGLAPD